MPEVVLAASWHEHVLEAYPSLPNEIRLLVVVEDGNLKLVVVGRIVDCETEFLIPSRHVLDKCYPTSHSEEEIRKS